MSLDSIAGVPVAKARLLHYGGLAGSNPIGQQGLDVQFGRLTAQQFKDLSATFGGKTEVPYDANRNYGVTDFLPPFAQALVNRDIDLRPLVTLAGTGHLREGRYEGEDFKVYSYTNCHGTAWETMRAYQSAPREVLLGFGDGLVVDEMYRDTSLFTEVGRSTSNSRPDLERLLATLKPGDVLAFREGDGLPLHSATYLGGGLVFEKPDTESDESSETPYRYVTLEQSLETAKQAAYVDELSVTALRPAKPLPTLEQAFAAPDRDAIARWAETKGTTVGVPLVRETEMGGMGGIVGLHVVAATPKTITLDQHRLGVIK